MAALLRLLILCLCVQSCSCTAQRKKCLVFDDCLEEEACVEGFCVPKTAHCEGIAKKKPKRKTAVLIFGTMLVFRVCFVQLLMGTQSTLVEKRIHKQIKTNVSIISTVKVVNAKSQNVVVRASQEAFAL